MADSAIEARVFGFVNFAHATGADGAFDLVGAELRGLLRSAIGLLSRREALQLLREVEDDDDAVPVRVTQFLDHQKTSLR